MPYESGATMQRRPRRNHTAAFKAKVALAAIEGARTLTQLAEQFSTFIQSDYVVEGAAGGRGCANVFGLGSSNGTSQPAIDMKSLHPR